MIHDFPFMLSPYEAFQPFFSILLDYRGGPIDQTIILLKTVQY